MFFLFLFFFLFSNEQLGFNGFITSYLNNDFNDFNDFNDYDDDDGINEIVNVEQNEFKVDLKFN